MMAAAGTADARPRARDAAARRGEAERALRTGHYEEARQIAVELRRRGADDAAPATARDSGRARRDRARPVPGSAPAPRDRRRGRARQPAGARRAHAPLRAHRRARRAGAAHRPHLRGLEARPRQPQPRRRPDRGRDRGAARRQLEGRQRHPARRRARGAALRVDASVAANLDWGWIFLEKHSAANAEQSFREVLKPSTRPTPTPTSASRASRSSSATTSTPPSTSWGWRWRSTRATRARWRCAARWRSTARSSRRSRRAPPRSGAPTRATAARPRWRPRRRWCSTIAPATSASATGIWRIHPGDGDFFAFVAEALIRHRRYDEARATAEEGVRADPRHARCQATLGTTLLRLGDETGRPRGAAARLEERSLRRAHVQPAQPVREGDPRALHHRRHEAPALSRRAGGAPGDRVGGRAVPRGDLPALRPALRAHARRAGGVRALRRSRATTRCAPSACRASASPASASGA